LIVSRIDEADVKHRGVPGDSDAWGGHERHWSGEICSISAEHQGHTNCMDFVVWACDPFKSSRWGRFGPIARAYGEISWDRRGRALEKSKSAIPLEVQFRVLSFTTLKEP